MLPERDPEPETEEESLQQGARTASEEKSHRHRPGPLGRLSSGSRSSTQKVNQESTVQPFKLEKQSQQMVSWNHSEEDDNMLNYAFWTENDCSFNCVEGKKILIFTASK